MGLPPHTLPSSPTLQECGGSSVFESFVAPILAEEDPSRPLWPASPSSGWQDGVDRLWGHPAPGRPLQIYTIPAPLTPVPGTACTAQAGARYFGFPITPFNVPVPGEEGGGEEQALSAMICGAHTP